MLDHSVLEQPTPPVLSVQVLFIKIIPSVQMDLFKSVRVTTHRLITVLLPHQHAAAALCRLQLIRHVIQRRPYTQHLPALMLLERLPHR